MISIIIATKDGAKSLPQAIRSIERQTEKHFEVIIVSDGSTDNTAELIEEMRANRPWLKLIEMPTNMGQSMARDKGIMESQGGYIAFLDDDDEWVDDRKLSAQKGFLEEHPDYVLVGAKEIIRIYEDGRKSTEYTYPTDDRDIRQQFLLRNCFATSSVMFRKDAYISCGGFRSYKVAEDYDLFIRMAKLGKVANLDHCSTAYAMRSGSSSKTNLHTLYKTIVKIVKENKSDYPNYWRGITKAYLRLIHFYLFSKGK